MNRLLQTTLVAVIIAKVKCDKEPELPLCPTDVQYMPQNMPMHCRMPVDGRFPRQAGLPLFPPALFPGAPAGGQPFPLPPGMPAPIMPPIGMPPPDAPPPGAPPPGVPPPGMPLPGPFPMPMPMPMQSSVPGHKLPLIVMPFYSPDPSYKKGQAAPNKRRRPRRPHYHRPHYDTSSSDTDSSSDTSTDTSGEGHGYWAGRRGTRGSRRSNNGPEKRNKRRHRRPRNNKELLTPVLQYVTKDGYVIFEKKISKNEAKDWLSMKKEKNGEEQRAPEDVEERNDNNDIAEAEMNPDVETFDSGRDYEREKPQGKHGHKVAKANRIQRAKKEDRTKETNP